MNANLKKKIKEIFQTNTSKEALTLKEKLELKKKEAKININYLIKYLRKKDWTGKYIEDINGKCTYKVWEISQDSFKTELIRTIISQIKQEINNKNDFTVFGDTATVYVAFKIYNEEI